MNITTKDQAVKFYEIQTQHLGKPKKDSKLVANDSISVGGINFWKIEHSDKNTGELIDASNNLFFVSEDRKLLPVLVEGDSEIEERLLEAYKNYELTLKIPNSLLIQIRTDDSLAGSIVLKDGHLELTGYSSAQDFKDYFETHKKEWEQSSFRVRYGGMGESGEIWHGYHYLTIDDDSFLVGLYDHIDLNLKKQEFDMKYIFRLT